MSDPIMGVRKYMLDDEGNAVLESDLIKWATWLDTADRVLAESTIGDAHIFTTFIGLDLRPFARQFDEPVLWETIIFGGAQHGHQQRYTSGEAARRGHEQACAIVRKSASEEYPIEPRITQIDADS